MYSTELKYILYDDVTSMLFLRNTANPSEMVGKAIKYSGCKIDGSHTNRVAFKYEFRCSTQNDVQIYHQQTVEQDKETAVCGIPDNNTYGGYNSIQESRDNQIPQVEIRTPITISLKYNSISSWFSSW